MRSAYSSGLYDRRGRRRRRAASVRAWFAVPAGGVLLAAAVIRARRVLARIRRGDPRPPRKRGNR